MKPVKRKRYYVNNPEMIKGGLNLEPYERKVHFAEGDTVIMLVGDTYGKFEEDFSGMKETRFIVQKLHPCIATMIRENGFLESFQYPYIDQHTTFVVRSGRKNVYTLPEMRKKAFGS